MIHPPKLAKRRYTMRHATRLFGRMRQIVIGGAALAVVAGVIGVVDVGIAYAATAPAITSSASTNFGVGTNGSFTVNATGTAPITFTEVGSLPSGVTFVSNGGSTATLSGTPAGGTSGVYPLTITASNGAAPNVSQNFTLNVWSSAPACNAWDSIQAPSGASTASFTISGAGGGGGGFGGSGAPGAGADGAQVNATYSVSGGQTLWVDIGCGGGGGADGTGNGHTALSGGGSAGTGLVPGGAGGGWYANGSASYAGAGGGGGASTVVCLQPASGGSSNCGSGDTELSIAAGGGGGGGTTCTDTAGAGGAGATAPPGALSGSGYSGYSGGAGGNEQTGGNSTAGGVGGTADRWNRWSLGNEQLGRQRRSRRCVAHGCRRSRRCASKLRLKDLRHRRWWWRWWMDGWRRRRRQQLRQQFGRCRGWRRWRFMGDHHLGRNRHLVRGADRDKYRLRTDHRSRHECGGRCRWFRQHSKWCQCLCGMCRWHLLELAAQQIIPDADGWRSSNWYRRHRSCGILDQFRVRQLLWIERQREHHLHRLRSLELGTEHVHVWRYHGGHGDCERKQHLQPFGGVHPDTVR